MDIFGNVDIPDYIPEGFERFKTTVLSGDTGTFSAIISRWDDILFAIGLLILGWIIMKLIQYTIKKTSDKIKLHHLSTKTGFTRFLEKAQIKAPPNVVIANFLGGYVFITFFLAASNVLELTAISEFLITVIRYIPQLVVALFIVLIGSEIADTAGAITESTLKVMDSGASKIMGLVARGVIILFAILAALFELDIAEDLVRILFTGVVAMIVLAGGLAIGLGSVDFVKKVISLYLGVKDKSDALNKKARKKMQNKKTNR